MLLIVSIYLRTLHRNYIMPYFDLIPFYEYVRLSFQKRGSNFLNYTVFTSMDSLLTQYIC